jgi:amino acid permease
MRNFLKRYFLPMVFLFSLAVSLWKFPFVTPLLGVFFVCFSLVTSISSILKKHKQSENPNFKIAKEILVLIVTALLTIFLGGVAGMYANQYAVQRFGVMVGIFSALGASFATGYSVRWGIGKAVRAD